MHRLFLLFLCLTLSGLSLSAQDDTAARKHVKQGNKQYQKRNFSEAETAYRKALEKNKNNPQALYNLGTSLIAQGQDTTAIKFFEQAVKVEKNPLRQSQSFHNVGTILQGRRMFKEAIEQYKNCLRLNPDDDDARYNLALCKYQLPKDSTSNSGGANQNQDQNQDQKQNQDKQQQDKQEKQQEEQKPQMSQDNAEQLLNAAMQQERQTQKKLKDAMKQPQKRQVEKNW